MGVKITESERGSRNGMRISHNFNFMRKTFLINLCNLTSAAGVTFAEFKTSPLIIYRIQTSSPSTCLQKSHS